MKLKYLKTFENFDDGDMGRFSDVESDDQDWLTHIKGEEEDEASCPCGTEGCPECSTEEDEDEEEFSDETNDFEDEEESVEDRVINRKRVWGDEVIEKKKNPFAKKAEDKKDDKKDSKKEDKKDDKKESGKGLTAKQKKLPVGLQKAILARKKK